MLPSQNHLQLLASTLDRLAKMTALSIDSGDLDAVAKLAQTARSHSRGDCAQSAQNGDNRYQDLIFKAIQYTGGGDVDQR